MKKIMYVLYACICFCFLGVSVQADLIFEPYEDPFYYKYAEECTYVNRVFTANGPDGIVILYESPDSAVEITAWKNGFTAYISFTYEDENGVLWGVYDNGDRKESGWMPMEYMEVVYDSISFEEEYADDIIEENGNLDEAYLETEVYVYQYPGAQDGYCVTVSGEDLPEYQCVFTDEEGRRWGRIGYYYGHKNKWICLQNPTADYDTLFPNGAPERSMKQEEAKEFGETRIIPEDTVPSGKIVIWVVVIVIGVVVATVILLMVLKRETKRQDN